MRPGAQGRVREYVGRMSSKRPAIDVVVVAYNSAATLRACLEPLAALGDVNLIVVDNASPEDPLPCIDGLDVHAVRAPRNGGFSYGCNLGAALGDAPYLLFLNPDAQLDVESLQALRAALDADHRVGLVAPRILDGNGTVLMSQRRFPSLRSTWSQALFLHRVFPRAAWSDELMRERGIYDRDGSPDWVSGACMLVRRSAFEAIGGFDEGFFLYCEDADLCLRLRQAGHEIRFVSAAEARHIEGSSAPRSALLRVHAQSRIYYAAKHFRALAASAERGGLALREVTRVITSSLRRGPVDGHAAALATVLRTRPPTART
jgi:N-acetylglucosaminyl-diphospho-decaprenol L-rhamnosyltransferase